MDRSELSELHYLTPIANIVSILQVGILSHKRARSVPHQSIAMPEIQDRRAKVIVPSGLPLHEYANLYINARNPMLYLRRDDHAALAVLRIDVGVLDLSGVVITSGNASSGYTRFDSADAGLETVDRDLVFARSWWSNNVIEYYRRKSAICAEVLVPSYVPPKHVTGAYVSCQRGLEELKKAAEGLAAMLHPELFFQG